MSRYPHVLYYSGHSIPKESKALIYFLYKFGAEKKLQRFNLKDIVKDLGVLRKGVLDDYDTPFCTRMGLVISLCSNHLIS